MDVNFWIIPSVLIAIIIGLRIFGLVREVRYNRKKNYITDQLYNKLKDGGSDDTNEKPREKKLYDYRVHKPLFTAEEYRFFEVLKDVVEDKALVFGQVRVSDVVNPVSGLSASERQSALNRIHMKHFDFVLCDKRDSSVLCVIELNDGTHKRQDRQDRDELLKHVCDSAGVKLFVTKPKRSYSRDVLREGLRPYLDSRL